MINYSVEYFELSEVRMCQVQLIEGIISTITMVGTIGIVDFSIFNPEIQIQVVVKMLTVISLSIYYFAQSNLTSCH